MAKEILKEEYNEYYSCPFVSPENWFKVPILAGENNHFLERMEERE